MAVLRRIRQKLLGSGVLAGVVVAALVMALLSPAQAQASSEQSLQDVGQPASSTQIETAATTVSSQSPDSVISASSGAFTEVTAIPAHIALGYSDSVGVFSKHAVVPSKGALLRLLLVVAVIAVALVAGARTSTRRG